MKCRQIILLMGAVLAFIEHNDGLTSLQATTAESTRQNIPYRRLEGVIKVPIRNEENVTAENADQCLLVILNRCRSGSRESSCAASFHPPSHTCVTSAPVFELLSLKESSNFIDQTPGGDWVTYVLVNSSLVTDLASPSTLWLLDSVSKGQNIGTGGRQLDASLKNIKWTEEGPRGRKLPLKYPLISKWMDDGPGGKRESRALILNIDESGKYLIDFSKPFTIALWFKLVVKGTLSRDSEFMFGDCASSGVLLKFNQYNDLGWLHLQLNAFLFHKYLSAEFPARFNQWRHLAAVYNGPRDVQFYLNGTFLKVKKVTNEYGNTISNPNHICLLKNKYDLLPNSVACVSIFERPLSQQQVAHVMQKCP